MHLLQRREDCYFFLSLIKVELGSLTFAVAPLQEEGKMCSNITLEPAGFMSKRHSENLPVMRKNKEENKNK